MLKNNNSGFTLIELMIVVVIIGILAAIAIPNFISMQDRAKEASTKSNCHTTQLAAEDWSVQNEGVYPLTTGDALPTSGNTMIDLLPGASLLTNPFTKGVTEPIDGLATTPGQTGYVNFLDPSGVSVGYEITGFGKDQLVLTVTSGQ